MSKKLTKEQVSQLSPEQQDLIGVLALEDGRKHRALLAATKRSPVSDYGSALVVVVGISVFISFPDSPYLYPFLAVLAAALIEAHRIAINARIDATNARIDAVIELSNLESNTHEEDATE